MSIGKNPMIAKRGVFFPPKHVGVWNKLTEETAEAGTIMTFKNTLWTGT